MEQRSSDTPAGNHRRGWGALNLLTVLTGQVVLLVSLFFFTLGWGLLPRVDPSRSGFGEVGQSEPLWPGWFIQVGLMMAAMVAVAGLACRRSDQEAVPGAVSQGIGGAVFIGGALLGFTFRSAFFFSGQGDRCAYPSCWPLYEQIAALMVPVVVTGLAMLAMAFLVRRWTWWVRALLPPALWLVLLVGQRVLWHSWLLPLFQQPPS